MQKDKTNMQVQKMVHAVFPKPKTHRDKKYLDFICSKECCICGKGSEPHHESGLGDSGGMALKCSDYFAIPLCSKCHRDRHDIGYLSFYKLFSLDVKRLIIEYLSEYIQSMP
jgi:hypothetical protein